MRSLKKQAGFTLYELLILVWLAFVVGVAGLAIWVAWHFISKWW